MLARRTIALAALALAATTSGCCQLGACGDFDPTGGPLHPLFRILHAHRFECAEWGCCPVGLSDSLHSCDPCDGHGNWIGCGDCTSCGGGGCATCGGGYAAGPHYVASPRPGSVGQSTPMMAQSGPKPRASVVVATRDAVAAPTTGGPRYVLKSPSKSKIRPVAHQDDPTNSQIKLRR